MNPQTRNQASGSHTVQPDARSQSDRTKDELKQDAQTIKQSVGKQADHQARKGRDEAVGTAKATGSALDRAADELRRDDQAPDWLASMLGKAANQIQQIASDIEDREPREMMHSVEDFGRERPGMFLAASAAAGFAAGRYLRAGAEQHEDVDAVQPGDPLGEANGDGFSQGSGRANRNGGQSRDRQGTAERAIGDPAITQTGGI